MESGMLEVMIVMAVIQVACLAYLAVLHGNIGSAIGDLRLSGMSIIDDLRSLRHESFLISGGIRDRNFDFTIRAYMDGVLVDSVVSPLMVAEGEHVLLLSPCTCPGELGSYRASPPEKVDNDDCYSKYIIASIDKVTGAQVKQPGSAISSLRFMVDVTVEEAA